MPDKELTFRNREDFAVLRRGEEQRRAQSSPMKNRLKTRIGLLEYLEERGMVKHAQYLTVDRAGNTGHECAPWCRVCELKREILAEDD